LVQVSVPVTVSALPVLVVSVLPLLVQVSVPVTVSALPVLVVVAAVVSSVSPAMVSVLPVLALLHLD
jgi:hypothetical protein